MGAAGSPGTFSEAGELGLGAFCFSTGSPDRLQVLVDNYKREIGNAMRAMLRAGGPAPNGRWGDLAVLEPVKDYKARHASTLLVFDAVEAALAKAEAKHQGEPAAAQA